MDERGELEMMIGGHTGVIQAKGACFDLFLSTGCSIIAHSRLSVKSSVAAACVSVATACPRCTCAPARLVSKQESQTDVFNEMYRQRKTYSR